MIPTSADERKRIIERRILNELARYYAQHKAGMGMNILAAKFSKALNPLGGFPEFIDELERAGKIRIDVKKSGARLVFPVDASEAPQSDDAANWF